MRFVSPDTTKIDLPVTDDGTKDWIEVKNELSAIEEKKFRSAGFKRLSQRKGDNDEATNDVEIDWAELAFARVVTYLVDWSAKDAAGKRMPVSRDAIKQLASEDFDVIDTAIQQHIEARAEEKKSPSGSPSLSAA